MSAGRRIVRPAVLREIPLDRHVVIDASAGTGKTFTLENLVVELVLSTDLTLDHLLCVTFTEKATHEIRARVRGKLQALIAGRGEPATPEQIGAGDAWTLDERGRKKLEAALHAFDAATIATIHAFCHRVLRENAFASGRCFEERQVDGREAFARAFRDALRGEVTRDPVRALWLEAALRSGWSIGRIEELVWNCVRERAPIRPTFDPAALDSALAAFPIDEAREPRNLGELKAWNVHANTAGSMVRALSDLADFVEKAREAGDAPLFVRDAKDVVVKLRDRLPALSPRPGRAARVVAAALDLVRATPPFSAAIAHALIDGVKGELARGKRASGRYDFDDMLSLVDEALRGPRGAALAETMRQRWRYALIDEFQDTDETQWSIFRRAFFERGPGSRRSVLLVVGDPKQSIYRFRGADVDTYLAASAEVLASGGARVRLGDNYRATPALVAATNRFFDQGAPDPFFTGDTAYEAVACGRPNRALVDGSGVPLSPVCALRFEGTMPLQDLGAWIANEARTATDPARPWRLDGRALEYRDLFVLTRTGREGREIGKALRAAGIPHAFYKEDGLFQTRAARDLRALLAAIEDPDDPARRVAAWLTPFFGLPLVEVERARGLSAAHPLLARLYAWKAMADARDFDRLFQSIAADSGFVRREIFFADGERDLTNILHIFEVLTERAHGGRATLRDLVQQLTGLIAKTRLPLDLEGNMQRLESDRSAVQIMTIHKAKGLEAPLVFLAGGLFAGGGDGERVRVFHEGGRRLAWVGSPTPDVKTIVDREEEDEEQRLMYVALTRAMGRLYLPCLLNTDGEPKPLRGAYDPVNRRIAVLVRQNDSLLTTVDVRAPEGDGVATEAAAPAWTPPAALLREDRDATPYASLRDRHAPPLVTSYTRMRGERESRSRWAERAEDWRAEKSASAVDDPSTTTLRAARASGIFLHEVLERAPLGSFRGSFGEWRARDDIAALFDETLAAHRIDPAQREHAEHLVWGAYMTPVALPGGGRLEGFAAAKGVTREMEFVYQVPGEDVPTLDAPETTDAPRASHAYVRGSLDLAFEHEGLTYFADWKSDWLAAYTPAALAGHVAAHYLDQARLYALAVVKLLGVVSRSDYEARFGGILYCFLRGFSESGGLWAARPGWNEIVAWDESLRLRRPQRERKS